MHRRGKEVLRSSMPIKYMRQLNNAKYSLKSDPNCILGTSIVKRSICCDDLREELGDQFGPTTPPLNVLSLEKSVRLESAGDTEKSDGGRD